jgi:hypothetical protein
VTYAIATGIRMTAEELLDAGDVVPGWTPRVEELF